MAEPRNMDVVLKTGDRATDVILRRAHIIREVDGTLAKTLCREVTLWAGVVQPGRGSGSWISVPGQDYDKPTCVTCGKRAEAAARKAGKS